MPTTAARRGLAVGLLVIILTACAGSGTRSGSTPAAPSVEPTAAATPTAEPTPTPEPTPEPTPDTAVYDACLEILEPLRDKLREIDSRLAVGISYADFDELVGEVAVEYGRVDVDELTELDFGCVSAGAELESMFQTYADAHDRWGECITDVDCTLDSIDPELQELWVTAEQHLAAADDEFDALRE